MEGARVAQDPRKWIWKVSGLSDNKLTDVAEQNLKRLIVSSPFVRILYSSPRDFRLSAAGFCLRLQELDFRLVRDRTRFTAGYHSASQPR